MCDADLIFINCIAKWPGSVHDSRVLRESSLFDAFESERRKPLKGCILGDSGYMMRDWLFTPLPNPATRQQRSYNFHHSSDRTAVERAIGVLKRRWHSLRRLRLAPAKACKVIAVCVMLHNRARVLKLEVPSDSDNDGVTHLPKTPMGRQSNLVLPTTQFRNEPTLQLVKLPASDSSTTSSEDNHLDRHLD